MPQKYGVLQPYAMWTDDCEGKKDYDGEILSIDTRYWPGRPYSSQPSATASIILRVGPKYENDGGGDYMIWRKSEFSASTEDEVKALVETWVQEQMAEVVSLLRGVSAFRLP